MAIKDIDIGSEYLYKGLSDLGQGLKDRRAMIINERRDKLDRAFAEKKLKASMDADEKQRRIDYDRHRAQMAENGVFIEPYEAVYGNKKENAKPPAMNEGAEARKAKLGTIMGRAPEPQSPVITAPDQVVDSPEIGQTQTAPSTYNGQATPSTYGAQVENATPSGNESDPIYNRVQEVQRQIKSAENAANQKANIDMQTKIGAIRNDIFENMPIEPERRVGWIQTNIESIKAAGLTPDMLISHQFTDAQILAKKNIESDTKSMWLGIAKEELIKKGKKVSIMDAEVKKLALQLEADNKRKETGLQTPLDELAVGGMVAEFKSTQELARSAVSNELGQVEYALNNVRDAKAKGVDTGPLSSLKAKAGEILSGVFGVSAEDSDLVKNANDYKQMIASFNDIILGKAENLKGALSNKELGFLKDAGANINNLNDANEYILNVHKSIILAKAEKAAFYKEKLAEARAKGLNFVDFGSQWSEHIKSRAAKGWKPVIGGKNIIGTPKFYHDWAQKHEVFKQKPLSNDERNLLTDVWSRLGIHADSSKDDFIVLNNGKKINFIDYFNEAWDFERSKNPTNIPTKQEVDQLYKRYISQARR